MSDYGEEDFENYDEEDFEVDLIIVPSCMHHEYLIDVIVNSEWLAIK